MLKKAVIDQAGIKITSTKAKFTWTKSKLMGQLLNSADGIQLNFTQEVNFTLMFHPRCAQTLKGALNAK